MWKLSLQLWHLSGLSSCAPRRSLCAGKLAHTGVVGGHWWGRLGGLWGASFGLLPAGQAQLAAVLRIVLVAAAAVGAHVQVIIDMHPL